ADLRVRAGAGDDPAPRRPVALGGEKARADGAAAGHGGRRDVSAVATDANTGNLLEARALTKRFGGVQALADVGFTIRRGEIYGLIGPNGAGKTTLFNLLTGIYAPDAGAFTFDGSPLQGLKPHAVAARGIARTFQNIRLFANLSALENVMIGRHVRTRAGVLGAVLRGPATRQEEADIQHRAFELLEFVG